MGKKRTLRGRESPPPPKKTKIQENSSNVSDFLEKLCKLTPEELKIIHGDNKESVDAWTTQIDVLRTCMAEKNTIPDLPGSLSASRAYFASVKSHMGIAALNVPSIFTAEFNKILTELDEIIAKKVESLSVDEQGIQLQRNEEVGESQEAGHSPDILDDLANICQLNDKCCSVSLWSENTFLLKTAQDANWNEFIFLQPDATLEEEEVDKEVEKQMKQQNVNFALVYSKVADEIKVVLLFMEPESDGQLMELDDSQEFKFVPDVYENLEKYSMADNEFISNFHSGIQKLMGGDQYLEEMKRTYFLTEDKQLVYIDMDNHSHKYFTLSDEQYDELCTYPEILKNDPKSNLLSLEAQSAIEKMLDCPAPTLFITSNNLGALNNNEQKHGKSQQENIIRCILTYFDVLQMTGQNQGKVSEDNITTLNDMRIAIALASAAGDVNSRHDRAWGQLSFEKKEQIIQQLLNDDSFDDGILKLDVSRRIHQNPDDRTSLLTFLSSAIRITNSLRRVEKAVVDKTLAFANSTIARIGEESEHAEMRQVAALLERGFFTDSRYKDKVIYLGISKACCLNCNLFLKAIHQVTEKHGYPAGKISYSEQTHGLYFRDYPFNADKAKWVIPHGFKEEGDNQEFLLDDINTGNEYLPSKEESTERVNRRNQPSRKSKQKLQSSDSKKNDESPKNRFVTEVINHYANLSKVARQNHHTKKRKKAPNSNKLEMSFLTKGTNNFKKLTDGLTYLKDLTEFNLSKDGASMNMDSPLSELKEDFADLAKVVMNLTSANKESTQLAISTENDAASQSQQNNFAKLARRITNASPVVLDSVVLHRTKLAIRPPVQDMQKATNPKWLKFTGDIPKEEMVTDLEAERFCQANEIQEFKNIKRDGNCFFNAVLAALPQYHPLNQAPNGDQKLREEAVQYMEQHPEKFPPSCVENEPLMEYLARMKQPTQWAEGPIIDATALVLNITIDMIELEKKENEIISTGRFTASEVNNAQGTILMLRVNQNHYHLGGSLKELQSQSELRPGAF